MALSCCRYWPAGARRHSTKRLLALNRRRRRKPRCARSARRGFQIKPTRAGLRRPHHPVAISSSQGSSRRRENAGRKSAGKQYDAKAESLKAVASLVGAKAKIKDARGTPDGVLVIVERADGSTRELSDARRGWSVETPPIRRLISCLEFLASGASPARLRFTSSHSPPDTSAPIRIEEASKHHSAAGTRHR